MLMDDTGRAMARPLLPSRFADGGPDSATSMTASAPDAAAAAFARAVEALLLLALTIPAAASLRRLALATRSADWHLVASPEHVAGTWLGVLAPRIAVWAQVSAAALPPLAMAAVNDARAVAALAHERPWDVHATTLAALRGALTEAQAAGRMQVRVTLARPVDDDGAPTLTVTLSAASLGEVLDAVEPIGDPPRPVWAYAREDDDEQRLLVLDGAGWLAEIDEDDRRPPVVGRAASPWPLRLERVVSTLDARHVGGVLVPALALEAR